MVLGLNQSIQDLLPRHSSLSQADLVVSEVAVDLAMVEVEDLAGLVAKAVVVDLDSVMEEVVDLG